MELAYQITEGDFVSAANLGMRKKSAFAVVSLYTLPFFGVIVLVAALVSGIRSGNWSSLIVMFIWGTILLLVPMIYPFQFRRVYRKSPLMQDRQTLVVDDEWLHFRSTHLDSRTTWSSYIKFSENDTVFILFQQG